MNNVPDVIQVEAYLPHECILIRNEKVSHYNDQIKVKNTETLREVGSFEAFLEATAGLIAGRRVLVALGDSRTGTISNWPWHLAKGRFAEIGHNFLVINFGGWLRFQEDRVKILEFYIPWLLSEGADDVIVCAFGCFGDLIYKQSQFVNYLEHGANSPLFENEEMLSEHRLGQELASIIRDTPIEWPEATQWIARRTISIFSIIEKIVTHLGGTYIAVLEPFAWADLSPNYDRALRKLYEVRDDESLSFEAWAGKQGYASSPSVCTKVDQYRFPIRPLFEQVRRRWPNKSEGRYGGNYVDWAALFFDVEDCCFVEYDGLHYNSWGSEHIAFNLTKLIKEKLVLAVPILEDVSAYTTAQDDAELDRNKTNDANDNGSLDITSSLENRKRMLLEAFTDHDVDHKRYHKSRAELIDFFMREVLLQHHRDIFWGDRMMTLDKSMGFLKDPAFDEAWQHVRGAHEYDQYDTRQTIAWRMNTLVWAARHALALPEGDLVECGVFQGDMSYVVYHAAKVAGTGRRMHLFDSFDGIDPGRVLPDEFQDDPTYVEVANVFYQRPGLYESVVARFVACPDVHIHKGFLPEGLDGKAPEKIAFLHVDLNAAGPEVQTLDTLYDRIVPSGLIVLDDYGWLALRAVKDAHDSFFAARGDTVLEIPTGQGLVVKRPRTP